jgi:hypothetical protein
MDSLTGEGIWHFPASGATTHGEALQRERLLIMSGRGHTGRREPFWPVFLPGQKPLCDFDLCKARFPAIFARHSGLAEDDCFRLGRVHSTLPGIQAEDGPPQSCPVVPRHPPRRSAGEIGGMFL